MNVLMCALLWLMAFSSPYAQSLSREQALQALTSSGAEARREAVGRLGEVGTMADSAALTAALRDPDDAVRDGAEQALWRVWSRSGDSAVDALFRAGIEQMNSGDLRASIATFTRIIQLKPDFAEGWNKRATLYFLADDLPKSLADCDEVIKRNPDHFGALAGYAQIYFRLQYYERALDYSRRALKVNPNMDAVRRNIDVIEHVIEQRRKQMI